MLYISIIWVNINNLNIQQMFKSQNRTLPITLSLISLLLTLMPTNSYKVSDFKPSILKPSHASAYFNVDTGQQREGEILCFGDINGDQYTDYIAINNRSSTQILIYFWNDKSSQFISDTINIQQLKPLSAIIEQSMLSDLSQDGSVQILITYSELPANSSNKIYTTIVYSTQNCGWKACSYKLYDISSAGLKNMTAPPTLINLDGNSNSFLLFQDTQRYISIKNGDTYTKSKFTDFMNSDAPNNNTFNKVNKHYTSNVDFDGDCNSDLVILSINKVGENILQFYTKQTNSKFILTKYLSFGLKNIQFYTMLDMDASGTIDIVLVINEQNKQNIYVLYNTIKSKQLCKKIQQFPFTLDSLKPMIIPYSVSSHNTLIFGDINSDSYPDLLTIVKINDFRKAMLFKNIEIDGNRQFQQSTDLNANLISQQKNPQQIAFFDLGEDGKLDVFVMVEEVRDSDRQSVITRTCFINNVKDDTLFIKILPLSQTSDYSTGSNHLSNAFGITIEWRITKLDGSKKISLLNQKSQWNYGTLHLPFVCGGLGRTNNYVQDLTVGYEGPGQKMSWSPVIPDSKLLVYKQNSQWKLETLLTNSQRVNQVIYVSVIILVVLGLVIFFLNYLQNKQDRRDQYNFIQLIR